MSDSIGDGRFNLPDYDQFEDESFPPLPPPRSPGLGGDDPFGNGEEDGDLSKLADVPTAKRRTVKRPQPKLDSQRLTSERGLPALRTLFDNVSFKGKGHEAEDLRVVMQKMENWAHRLYPKLQFDDFMDKVEKLGSKKDVQTCLKRIRLDMPLVHEDFIGEKEVTPVQHVFEDPDPFGSTGRFPLDSQGPVHSTPATTLTEEQLRRIQLNKQLALERRLARKQPPPTDLPDSQTDSSQAVSAQTDSSQAVSAQTDSSQAVSAQTDSSQAVSAQTASSQAISAQAASSQAGVQASSVHLPPAISPPTEPCPLVPLFEERKDMDVGPSTEPPRDAKLDPA